MIYTLSISNIALIGELSIQFTEGLNVMTGETGAGKSIIVDSMNLVLGERADRELIRTGETSAKVEAVFYVDNAVLADLYEKYGVMEAEELIISRTLSADGKNNCRINGSIVNLGTLKAFTDRIVDLHGQHEHQYLLQSKTHIDFVDNFAEKALASSKKEMRALLKEHRSLMEQLDSIGGTPQERARSIDLLRFEIDEITSAAIRPGEEAEIKEELAAALNAEKIAEALAECHLSLYSRQESLLSELKKITRGIESITQYSKGYAALADRLNESYYSLEDIALEAQAERDKVALDESCIAQMQERLDLFFSLKRKYGGSEEAILDYLHSAQAQLENLENSDAQLIEIQTRLSAVSKKLYECSEQLSQLRRSASEKLAMLIQTELKDLGMSTARFNVHFDPLPGEEKARFSENGLDQVEFVISTNIGEPLKPLSKIVSGGEVSRIMLAFKNVLAKTDRVGTLIFDEIDTGISGNMAHVVAEKLSKIARDKQVICVSHLPQIAAIADSNYLISKRRQGEKMATEVSRLEYEEKIAEVSRLSGGTNTQSSFAHAKELIEKADRAKCR